MARIIFSGLIVISLFFFSAQLLPVLDEKAPWRFHDAVREGDLTAIQQMIKDGFDFRNQDTGGVSALHSAAACGHIELVKFFLDKGLDIHQKIERGYSNGPCSENPIDFEKQVTALLCAAENGHTDIVRLLLERGAKLEESNARGDNILHIAAKQGLIPLLEVGIKAGLSLESKNKDGQTALWLTVHHEQERAALFLMKQGADMNCSPDGKADELLGEAIVRTLPSVVSHLLERGASLGYRDEYKRTCLELALFFNHENMEIVDTLLSKGADITVHSHCSVSALPYPYHAAMIGKLDLFNRFSSLITDWHKPCDWNAWCTIRYEKLTLLHWAAIGGHVTIAQRCLDKHLDVNTLDGAGKTPLWYAAINGRKEMVDYLLKKGADFMDPDELPLLHAAVIGDLIDLVRLCLEKGYDIKCEKKYKQSILHLCNLEDSKLTMLRFLVEKGAPLNSLDYDQKTVLTRALEKNHLEAAEFLKQHGAIENMETFTQRNINQRRNLRDAAADNDIFRVEKLLREGVDINSVYKYGTALDQAAVDGNLNMVKYLLNHGAQLNKTDSQGKNAMHHAVKGGSIRMIDFLIDLGAELNRQDEEGKTAAFYALDKLEILKRLFLNGASDRITDHEGNTLLHWACKPSQFDNVPKATELITFLLSRNLDINALNSTQESPLFFAVREGNAPLIIWLLDHGASPSLSDKNDWTALHDMFDSFDISDINIEAVKKLIEQNADVNAKTRQPVLDHKYYPMYRYPVGSTPLDILMTKFFSEDRISKEGKILIKFLKSKGAVLHKKAEIIEDQDE